MKVCCLFFSGTGNTAFVVHSSEKLFTEKGHEFISVSIENAKQSDYDAIADASLCIFAYPVYGSTVPEIMRDFLSVHHKQLPHTKTAVFVTQYLFSGDGGACGARLLTEYGFEVVDIEHFRMPSNLCDGSVFTVQSDQVNRGLIRKTLSRIEPYVNRLITGNYTRIGVTWYSRVLGMFQRVPFQYAEKYYKSMLKVDPVRCTMCGLCVSYCPVSNLQIKDARIEVSNECTLCYRCVNICPERAIAFLKKSGKFIQYKPVFDASGTISIE